MRPQPVPSRRQDLSHLAGTVTKAAATDPVAPHVPAATASAGATSSTGLTGITGVAGHTGNGGDTGSAAMAGGATITGGAGTAGTTAATSIAGGTSVASATGNAAIAGATPTGGDGSRAGGAAASSRAVRGTSKLSVYVPTDIVERARTAWRRSGAVPGAQMLSWSGWVSRAIEQALLAAEEADNGGRPFEPTPAGMSPTGRPPRL